MEKSSGFPLLKQDVSAQQVERMLESVSGNQWELQSCRRRERERGFLFLLGGSEPGLRRVQLRPRPVWVGKMKDGVGKKLK